MIVNLLNSLDLHSVFVCVSVCFWWVLPDVCSKFYTKCVVAFKTDFFLQFLELAATANLSTQFLSFLRFAWFLKHAISNSFD